MRYTSLGALALMAILMLAAAPARAFEFDSVGSTNPDGSARYTDPDNLFEPKANQAEETEAPNGAAILHGLQLNMSSSGSVPSSSVNAGAMGWTNPQPGRLTH
jgi:hypothetical protein